MKLDGDKARWMKIKQEMFNVFFALVLNISNRPWYTERPGKVDSSWGNDKIPADFKLI